MSEAAAHCGHQGVNRRCCRAQAEVENSMKLGFYHRWVQSPTAPGVMNPAPPSDGSAAESSPAVVWGKEMRLGICKQVMRAESALVGDDCSCKTQARSTVTQSRLPIATLSPVVPRGLCPPFICGSVTERRLWIRNEKCPPPEAHRGGCADRKDGAREGGEEEPGATNCHGASEGDGPRLAPGGLGGGVHSEGGRGKGK